METFKSEMPDAPDMTAKFENEDETTETAEAKLAHGIERLQEDFGAVPEAREFTAARER